MRSEEPLREADTRITARMSRGPGGEVRREYIVRGVAYSDLDDLRRALDRGGRRGR